MERDTSPVPPRPLRCPALIIEQGRAIAPRPAPRGHGRRNRGRCVRSTKSIRHPRRKSIKPETPRPSRIPGPAPPSAPRGRRPGGFHRRERGTPVDLPTSTHRLRGAARPRPPADSSAEKQQQREIGIGSGRGSRATRIMPEPRQPQIEPLTEHGARGAARLQIGMGRLEILQRGIGKPAETPEYWSMTRALGKPAPCSGETGFAPQRRLSAADLEPLAAEGSLVGHRRHALSTFAADGPSPARRQRRSAAASSPSAWRAPAHVRVVCAPSPRAEPARASGNGPGTKAHALHPAP